jgi:hypothetical protein
VPLSSDRLLLDVDGKGVIVGEPRPTTFPNSRHLLPGSCGRDGRRQRRLRARPAKALVEASATTQRSEPRKALGRRDWHSAQRSPRNTPSAWYIQQSPLGQDDIFEAPGAIGNLDGNDRAADRQEADLTPFPSSVSPLRLASSVYSIAGSILPNSFTFR